jgi:hypothetical protein
MMHGQRKHGWVTGAVLLALGLAVTSLAVAAGGGGDKRSSPTWTHASAHKRVGYAPDPPPMRSAHQWLLTFRYRRGKVELLSARRLRLKHAVTTPRRIGRYAVELLSGPTVIERLRFDFPLIGAEELAGQRRPYNAPPPFATKATVTHRVMLPDTPRASRARLVDRATGGSFMIPWPPTNVGRAKPAQKTSPRDAGKEAGHDASRDGGAEGGKDASEADAPKRPDAMKRREAAVPEAAPLESGTK